MKIDFTELLKAQKELDDVIIGDKKIENLTENKLVALSVELAELFNEIRCFKYWSNKGPSKKEVIIEEYVDVLHFWLSLANDKGIVVGTVNGIYPKVEFLEELYISLIDDITRDYLPLFIIEFLSLGEMLGFTEKEIIEAYYRKRDINFKRQQEGY